MGCCGSKEKSKEEFSNLNSSTNNTSSTAESNSEDSQKQYSWSNRKVDRSNFIVNGKIGESIIRKPGSLNGSQFKLEKCEDCDIFVFDFTDSVYIDNCKNCRIFIGPVKGSIFFRTSTNCRCITACKQFRVRDCDSIDILLYCSTPPVIETSKNMRFGCFHYNYEQLLELFPKASLSVFANSWSAVYDFNHVQDSWSFLNDEDIPSPFLKSYEGFTNENCRVKSAVPKTWGTARPRPFETTRFLVFREGATENILEYLEKIQKEPGIIVVQIAEKDSTVGVELCVEDPDQADKIIQPSSSISYVTEPSTVQNYVTQYFGQIQLEI